jgi:hypothetical protein
LLRDCSIRSLRLSHDARGRNRIRALARERQVSFPKHPFEWAEWQNIIDQIDARAKVATAGMSRGAERDAALAFYTAAIAQLRAFKETRNRIMHVRGSFDELDAQRAINQVRGFMNGLSAKCDGPGRLDSFRGE